MTRIVWLRWWLLLFLPAGLLVGAPGDRPLIAVPSALVLVAGVVAWALYLRRLYGFARRWVADPPEMPPPRRWERWISGWRWVWVFAVLLVTAVGVGVVLGLVDR
jgi:hypothetical protein